MVRSIPKLLIILLAAVLAFGTSSCNSKKKLAKQEYESMISKAKHDLNSIIDGSSKLTLDEKENLVESIKGMNLDDPDINDLIAQAEATLANERSILIQKQLDEKKKAEEAAKKQTGKAFTIQDYFSSIARSSNANEANMFINDALGLFESPDSPVLIIISRQGDIVDYDRPTTIKNYLNYLKDTKNNINTVENIKYNGSGKITEMELLKNL